eukprot:TRINITY_DN5457_c0_g5_i1.p1 TRINITY_DN5457_c0_g5~~TRINITY_DN5457_c0_g5_i1.p1  ORF type:complete len:1416 (-),score=261.39 TRINITY_DN5457_c0_g5_i1:48-3983(-)
MGTPMMASREMTVEKCHIFCTSKGVTDFGLLQHSRCLCGYHFEEKPVPDYFCPSACAGVDVHTCGGPGTATVFHAKKKDSEDIVRNVEDDILAKAEKTGTLSNPEGSDSPRAATDTRATSRDVHRIKGSDSLPSWAGGLAWPGKRVAYRFAPNETEKTRTKFRDAIAAYTRHTCLRFVEVSEEFGFALMVTSQQVQDGAEGWSLLGYKGPVLAQVLPAFDSLKVEGIFAAGENLDDVFKTPLVQLKSEGRLSATGELFLKLNGLPYGLALSDFPGFDGLFAKPSKAVATYEKQIPGLDAKEPRQKATIGNLKTIDHAPDCCGKGEKIGCKNCQPLQLNSGCPLGTAIHELGHALGFLHTQQRLDRDKYVEVHFDNLKPDSSSQYEKGARSFQGTYDYGSIMHYSVWQGNQVPDNLYELVSAMVSKGKLPKRLNSYFQDSSEWPPREQNFFGIIDYLHDQYANLGVPLAALALGLVKHGDRWEDALYSSEVVAKRFLSRETLAAAPVEQCPLQELLLVGWDLKMMKAAYDVWDMFRQDASYATAMSISPERCGECCDHWKNGVCAFIMGFLETLHPKWLRMANKVTGYDLTEVCGKRFGMLALELMVAVIREPAGWRSMSPVQKMPTGTRMGQRSTLSLVDVETVNEVYSCPEMDDSLESSAPPGIEVKVQNAGPGGRVTTTSSIEVKYWGPKELMSDADRVQIVDAKTGKVLRKEVLPEVSPNNPLPFASDVVVLHLNPSTNFEFQDQRSAELLPVGDYVVELAIAKLQQSGQKLPSYKIRVDMQGLTPPGQAMVLFEDSGAFDKLVWIQPRSSADDISYAIERADFSLDVVSNTCSNWKAESGTIEWRTPSNKTCVHFEDMSLRCEYLKEQGLENKTGKDACCVCGGGVRPLMTDIGARETFPNAHTVDCSDTWSSLDSIAYDGRIRVRCPTCKVWKAHSVYGSESSYHPDSNLCYAAIHAGVIPESGGTFFVSKSVVRKVLFPAGETRFRVTPKTRDDSRSARHLSYGFTVEKAYSVKAELSAWKVVARTERPFAWGESLYDGCKWKEASPHAPKTSYYYGCIFRIVAVDAVSGLSVAGVPSPLPWREDVLAKVSEMGGLAGPVRRRLKEVIKTRIFTPLQVEPCHRSICLVSAQTDKRNLCRISHCRDCNFDFCKSCLAGNVSYKTKIGVDAVVPVPDGEDLKSDIIHCKKGGRFGNSGFFKVTCSYGFWSVTSENCEEWVAPKCQAKTFKLQGYRGGKMVQMEVALPDSPITEGVLYFPLRDADGDDMGGSAECSCRQGDERLSYAYWMCVERTTKLPAARRVTALT